MAKSRIADITDEQWQLVNVFNRKKAEEFLEQAHLSDATLKQYASALKIFLVWVYEEQEDKKIIELKPRHALSYQNYLIRKGLSSNAVKFKRSVVSSFCGYMEVYYGEEYETFRNIYSKSIPNPQKQNINEKIPLTLEEYNLLLETLITQEEWQMVAYLQFSYYSSGRRAEVLQITKDIMNIPAEQGNDGTFYTINNIRGKGRGKEGKPIKLRFTQEARDAIEKWLEVRGDDDCPYIFVHKRKNGKTSQLKVETFNNWCSTKFTEIVGRRTYPHLFRSTRATHLKVNYGKSIESIKNLLNHNSSETTQIYIVDPKQDSVDDLF